MKNKIKGKLRFMISFLSLLFFWQILYSFGPWSEYLLPSPLRVFKTLLEISLSGELFKDAAISLYRVFTGLSIAFVLAVFFAIISYMQPKIHRNYHWLLEFFKNIPPLSLIPLLILWLGIGEESKLMMIILASFFPLYLNIQKGLICTDKELLEVSQMLGYNSWGRFTSIVIPSSLKDTFIGMRIALGYAWRSIIAAEMIAASSGLGYFINFSRQMSRTDRVIAGIIVIGILGYCSDIIFVKAASKLLKGDLKNEWYHD